MKVSIVGTGYVGLVTGACLADVGNEVLCLDVDARKIERLKRGEVPIYEPGLQQIVHANAAAGRLTFTTDAAEGARETGHVGRGAGCGTLGARRGDKWRRPAAGARCAARAHRS